MICPRRDPRSRFDSIRPTTLLLFSLLLLAAPVAQAQVADLLILSTTVTSPGSSVEEQEAATLGLSVNVVTAEQWAAMTTEDFAQYRAIVLGDTTCSVSLSPVQPAIDNREVWGPAIDGNVIVFGSDPVFHSSLTGARTAIRNFIEFAAAGVGRTGAYICLSCYGHGDPAAVENLLDPFGTFELGGGYGDNVHIVAEHPALEDLADADLAYWYTSIHEPFISWPADFLVLAIALDAESDYVAPDGTSGQPYILARGEGLRVLSDIDLAPETASRSLGASITLTATVLQDEAPLPGTLVTFEVISGPNAGMTGAATTGSEGTASFTYSNSTAGTDVIVARFVDADERTQTSNQATVDWGLVGPGIYGVGDWAEAFDLWTYEVDGQPRKVGFLAAQTAGVHILDVTNPLDLESPDFEPLGVYLPDSCPGNDGTPVLFRADDVVFVEEQGAIHVSAGPCGVHVVDVADPFAPDFEPTLVAIYDTPAWAEAVKVHAAGGVVRSFVADYDGFRVFDVSDPAGAGPQLMASLGVPSAELGPAGVHVVNVDLLDVDLGDEIRMHALVATSNGFRVLDVEDCVAPAASACSPALVGSYDIDPSAVGAYPQPQDIVVDAGSNIVHLPIWGGGYQVVDVSVSNLAAPDVIDTFEPEAYSTYGTAFFTGVPFGGRIYATEGLRGLRVLELLGGTSPSLATAPTDPISIGGAGTWAWDVMVADCTAYVTFGDENTLEGGLQVTPLEDCEGPSPVDPVGGETDNDTDGVADTEDNCLETSNADQTDSDLDGFGNACDADYDGDGMVGTADFVLFSAAWGALASDERYDARADHDADGVIDELDFMILSQRWGEPPGPSGLVCAGSVPCP